jgi:GH18 family chitinase
MFRYNQDIPGAIELVHPNKFLPNLRPVEEFRHTPIIPISEKDLFKHQQEVEQRNRKGYYVEIKKDTLYFYTISCLTLGIIFYAFLMVNES